MGRKEVWTREQADFDRRTRRGFDPVLVNIKTKGKPRLQDVVFSVLMWMDAENTTASVRPLDHCPVPMLVETGGVDYRVSLSPDCRPYKEVGTADKWDACFGALPYGYVYVERDEFEGSLAQKAYRKTWWYCLRQLWYVVGGWVLLGVSRTVSCFRLTFKRGLRLV